MWIGAPGEKILFCFSSDMDLVGDDGQAAAGGRPGDGQPGPDRTVDVLFKDPDGRYDLTSLASGAQQSPSALVERLWHAVWQGQVANDSFVTLRKGVENRFKVPDDVLAGDKNTLSRRGPAGRRYGGRGRFSRWKGAMPFSGRWFRVPYPAVGDDAIEAAERKKERIRILLDRYGILFRELLNRERPPFQWRHLFRTMRMMELSGEVLSGYFFNGIPGPQFISHRAFQLLRRAPAPSDIFWINAMDPASLCGVPLEMLKDRLPRRSSGTHLVYKGTRLVLTSQRFGKRLYFRVPGDDPDMQGYLGLFHHLLNRRFRPLRQITIETINDETAARSPYADAFKAAFDVLVDYRDVVLYRIV
jgi:ATP-dependent Lhr-like helicase